MVGRIDPNAPSRAAESPVVTREEAEGFLKTWLPVAERIDAWRIAGPRGKQTRANVMPAYIRRGREGSSGVPNVFSDAYHRGSRDGSNEVT